MFNANYAMHLLSESEKIIKYFLVVVETLKSIGHRLLWNLLSEISFLSEERKGSLLNTHS